MVLPRVPGIFSLKPLGGMRGQTTRVEILGENLDGARSLEFDGSGLKARILESSYLRALAEVSIAADAVPGVRCVRLFSPLGASNLLGFHVDTLPESEEHEPNNSRETAQELSWPSAVNGVIYPDEDTDFYRIRGRAEQGVTIEVLAARIGSGLDSEMYLLDPAGRRLAAGDNEAGSDPVIHYLFKDNNDYYVVIRSIFSVLNISFPTGHPSYTYQLRISSPPHLGYVYPFGAQPGQLVDVDLVGDALQSVKALEVARPGIEPEILDVKPDHIRARLRIGRTASGRYELRCLSPEGLSDPVRFVVSDLPLIREHEPNDEAGLANRVRIPAVVEGEIGRQGDVDSYVFTIDEKGPYVFEVQAGRFNSDLDSVISLYDSKGKLLAENDDGFFPGESASGDSKLEYAFASPGEYVLRIRQAVLNLSGPQYHYRVIFRSASPHFALLPASETEAFPAVRGPDRWVAETGTKIEIPVRVLWLEGLEGFGASVKVSVEGLPPGVMAEPVWAKVHDGKYPSDSEPFTANVKIPLTVSLQAHLGSFRVRIKGEAHVGAKQITAWETVPVSVVGQYTLAATGGFSGTLDYCYLSIVRPAKFMLRAEMGDLRYPVPFSMQPGTQKDLVVTIIAAEDFRAALQFTAVNLPRGVQIESIDRRPASNQYVLHLRAAPDCDTGWSPIVTLVATGEVNGQKVTASTPYFGMAVQ